MQCEAGSPRSFFPLHHIAEECDMAAELFGHPREVKALVPAQKIVFIVFVHDECMEFVREQIGIGRLQFSLRDHVLEEPGHNRSRRLYVFLDEKTPYPFVVELFARKNPEYLVHSWYPNESETLEHRGFQRLFEGEVFDVRASVPVGAMPGPTPNMPAASFLWRARIASRMSSFPSKWL